MNKKGMVYLLTVSFLTVSLLLIFLSHQAFEFQESQRIESSKIYAMDDFIKDVNSDVVRVLEITGYRAFVAMEDYVSVSGEFFDDKESVMAEAISDGTIRGSSAILMDESSLEDYFKRLNAISEQRGIKANYSIINVSLEHKSPWDVELSVFMNIFILDVQETAKWNYTKEFSSEISIYGLRDPLYSVMTQNRVPNIIRSQNQSLDSGPVLEEHIRNGHYVESDDAPSFLQRFENDLEPSEFGIESIVYLRDLSQQDIPVDLARPKVDFIYFNDLEIEDLACDFTQIPEDLHLVLPEDRLDLYGLSDSSYSTNC